MALRAISFKMAPIYKALANELDLDATAVDVELSDLATVSVRVEFDKGEVDFALIVPNDTPEQMREKFVKYIDTDCYRAVDQALREIGMADQPITPPEQQPGLPKDAPKNS